MRALLLALTLSVATAEAWTLKTADGAPATLEQLGRAMATSDVVVVGEQHDDAAGHAFELALLKQAFLAAPPERTVTLSLEMFERDVQPVLDEYLAGHIREEDFLAASRPWPNYKEAYQPLVEFARTHALPVIAANAPRRYASRAARLGASSLAGLPASARAWLPPLPLPTPSAAYAHKFEGFLASGEAGSHTGPAHTFDGQWLRDTTMARAIATHARAHPRALIVHITGAFHSEGGLGTPEAIAFYAPTLKPLIVTMNPESPKGNDFVVRTHP